MRQQHRAIIIGGGIAGPALALFLQRGGITPQIFEAYPEPATIGGGFQIAPNGMRVMAALGLDGQVKAAGAVTSKFAFRNHQGRALGQIDLQRCGFGVTIRRDAFHRILLDEAGQRGLSVTYNKRLRAIEDSGNEVVAHFEDGSMAWGDMLLATDGVHSRARTLLLPDHAKPRYTGVLGVGGFAETDSSPTNAEDSQRLNFTVGPRMQFGYATFSAQPTQWGWWCHLPQQPELTRKELQAIPDDDFRSRILSAFRGWHSPIEAFISMTGPILRTAIYDVPPLPTWHAGRVMLIGDAAHAMSPAGGQGASLALEDAMLLGQRLSQSSEPVGQVFAEVESILRPRAQRIVAQAAQNDVRQLKQLGKLGCRVRDLIFPLLVPVIARDLERQYLSLSSTLARAA